MTTKSSLLLTKKQNVYKVDFNYLAKQNAKCFDSIEDTIIGYDIVD